MSKRNQAASDAGGDRFPGQGVFHDHAGLEVDGRAVVWRLNNARVSSSLNWQLMPTMSVEMFEATTAYLRSVIESQNAQSAYNTFAHLKDVLSSPEFSRVLAEGDAPGTEALREFLRRDGNHWRGHYARQWYSWCATMGYEAFSPEVALELSRLRIGGNEKGRAVLSADPEEGPLLDHEVSSLIAALRGSGDRLSLREKAIIWLCLALGPNPIQISLLREEDVKVIYDGDSPAFVHLAVPRIKKREAGFRQSFRTRSLTWEIGTILLDLIEENAARRRDAGVPERLAHIKPLIPRDNVAATMLGTPLEELAFHLRSPDVGKLLTGAIERLAVPSREAGKLLHVTCRRLRYTFATRLVREGVSKREIADLLDHTDLQHVQIYYDIKSDIVEKLDKAMAMALAPVAQAFMGKIVPNSGAAIRGDDPAASIAVPDRDNAAIREVGTCGEYSFCRLSAPVACYTCVKFQPWIDAPHHLLLDDLLKDRERRQQAGLDGRMVTLMDTTILAIADVIGRIETLKAETAS